MARAIGTGPAYATLPVTLQFDGEGLRELSRDLMSAANALKRESAVVLPKIGEPVAEDARQIAASHGSTKIPQSIRTAMKDSLTFQILAGGPGVPEAGLWEFGNRGDSPDRPVFDHPIFGKGTTTQPRYPFMRPALKKNRYLITKEIYQMWSRVLTPYRLTPE